MIIDEFGNEEYSEEELDDICDEYYEKMDISDEDKEERKKLAKELYALLIFLLLLLQNQVIYKALDVEQVISQFRARLKTICFKYTTIDTYIEKYINKVTTNVIKTTVDNMEKSDYWTSGERALSIALDESNSILNYDDFQRAKALGYTRKKWVTMKDNRVRRKHRVLDGKTIPIDDKFKVGSSRLLFPRDEVNCVDLEDIAGCRCALKYIP